MSWVLVICTQGWVLCGQLVETTYPTEAACYRAMDELYRRNDKDDFKYVLCRPTHKDRPND